MAQEQGRRGGGGAEATPLLLFHLPLPMATSSGRAGMSPSQDKVLVPEADTEGDSSWDRMVSCPSSLSWTGGPSLSLNPPLHMCLPSLCCSNQRSSSHTINSKRLVYKS